MRRNWGDIFKVIVKSLHLGRSYIVWLEIHSFWNFEYWKWSKTRNTTQLFAIKVISFVHQYLFLFFSIGVEDLLAFISPFHFCRSAEIVYSLALAHSWHNGASTSAKNLMTGMSTWLQEARRDLGLFQHHDGITGTGKAHVMQDYKNKCVLRQGLPAVTIRYFRIW